MTRAAWPDSARAKAHEKRQALYDVRGKVRAVLSAEWRTAWELTRAIYGEAATPAQWFAVCGALEMLQSVHAAQAKQLDDARATWVYAQLTRDETGVQ